MIELILSQKEFDVLIELLRITDYTKLSQDKCDTLRGINDNLKCQQS